MFETTQKIKLIQEIGFSQGWKRIRPIYHDYKKV